MKLRIWQAGGEPIGSVGRRSGRVSAAPLICVIAALSCALLLNRPSIAGADCGTPSVSVSKAVVTAGERVMVTGRAFGTECNDTRTVGDTRPLLGPPARDLQVAFIQGGTRVPIGRVSANESYEVSASVSIPASARVGAAQIDVGQAPVSVIVAEAPRAQQRSPTSAPAQPSSTGSGGATRTWIVLVVIAVVLIAFMAAIGLRQRMRQQEGT